MSVPVAIRTSIAMPPATRNRRPSARNSAIALRLGDRAPRRPDGQREHHHPAGPHGRADQVQRADAVSEAASTAAQA